MLQTHLQSHKNLTRHDMQAQCHTDRSPSTFSADVSSAYSFLRAGCSTPILMNITPAQRERFHVLWGLLADTQEFGIFKPDPFLCSAITEGHVGITLSIVPVESLQVTRVNLILSDVDIKHGVAIALTNRRISREIYPRPGRISPAPFFIVGWIEAFSSDVLWQIGWWYHACQHGNIALGRVL